MTRYTNVARKRTYVEAGFASKHDLDDTLFVENTIGTEDAEGHNPEEANEEKKRKRSSTSKAQGQSDVGHTEIEESVEHHSGDHVPQGADVGDRASRGRRPGRGESSTRRPKHLKGAEARKAASEQRRLQRIAERYADTTCYACREKGHAAKDCPNAVQSPGNNRRKSTVGICYRCGSKTHNLSNCREKVNPANPLPFASCFVCSSQGHLASSCPQNQANGVYPNGGCCKLCGENTHLAKNCSLRKADVTKATSFFGTGQDAGADEDDFHTLKRRTAEVDKAEKTDERLKRQVNIKIGAHTGVVKSFAKLPVVKKKVVNF